MTAVVQSDLQCPACAGQCRFDPVTGTLACQSCGATHTIVTDPDADPAAEFHYHPDLPHTEQKRHTPDVAHHCETCGGTVVFAGPALSTQCAYCDGPMVLTEEAASYETLGMIPFRLDDPDAQKRALDWAADRVAAPNDLARIVGEGRVAGIYVPFWTFDSNEDVDYKVTYKVKSGDNWVSRLVTGNMNITFDDLLMPASRHVTPLIRDGILHDFDPDALKPYTPAYLSGFAAERHQQSVTEWLQANEPDKRLLIRNRIKRHSGKSSITNVSYKTHTTGIKYRRILLPVWILHYQYNGKPMKIVTCGIRGRTFGERPFSYGKLFLISAAISAAVIAFGWVWGAARLL